MNFSTSRLHTPGIALAYLVVAVVIWQGNADLPLEFHDRGMFADHDRIADAPAFFFSDEKAQYNGRWLANAYQFAVYRLAGENAPWLYRLLALLLHGVATALLVALALRAGLSSLVAHGAGLWFLVTPSHYQVIHHISAVDYILCTLFGLSALLRVLVHRSWDGWVAVALVCAALSHQAGVVFAGLCWALVYKGRWRIGILRALMLMGAGGLLLWSLPAETSGQGAIRVFGEMPFPRYVLAVAHFFLGQLGRQAVFAFHFPLSPNSSSIWLVIAGAGVLLGIAALVYKKHPAHPWALGFLILTLPFVSLLSEVRAGLPAGPLRYLYIASGFAFVAFMALVQPLGRGLLVVVVAGGVIISLLAWPIARELTRCSAARAAAAEGYEKEALALYRPLWQSEHLPEAYIEEAHVNGLMLALGWADDFRELLAGGFARYPQNYHLQLMTLSVEMVEDPQAVRRYGQIWGEESAASQVVGSALYRLFRRYAREHEHEKMYAALALSQALSSREHTEKTLFEVREGLRIQGRLERLQEKYERAYGPVLKGD